MELSVNHVTSFEYGGPVRDSVNEVRLCPRTDALQSTLDFQLVTVPPAEVRSFADSFGNTVHTFDIPDPHTHLTITAMSRVLTRPVEAHAAGAPRDRYRPISQQEAGDLIDYLQPTRRVDFASGIGQFAHALRDACQTEELGALVDLVRETIHQRFEYVPGATDVGTIASDALAAARGVCQDYTHVMLAALRVLGIPARYTSGYFHAEGTDTTLGEGASHAWVEAWFPSYGWVGVDPTNNRGVDEQYIRVAYGRDYGDVSPVRGSYRGSETSIMAVGVRVTAGLQQQQ